MVFYINIFWNEETDNAIHRFSLGQTWAWEQKIKFMWQSIRLVAEINWTNSPKVITNATSGELKLEFKLVASCLISHVLIQKKPAMSLLWFEPLKMQLRHREIVKYYTPLEKWCYRWRHNAPKNFLWDQQTRAFTRFVRKNCCRFSSLFMKVEFLYILSMNW